MSAEISVLSRLRRELNVTREDIVRVTTISLATVRNAERGRQVRYQTALQILMAMNYWILQKKVDRPELTLSDLSLTVGAR